MSEDDFVLEQEYVRAKQRRHDLLLHGVGIAWGLEVTVESDQTTGDDVVVSPGLAIGPDGEEVSRVEEVVEVDVLPNPPVSHLEIARVKRAGRRWRVDPTFKAPHQDR